jgi:hypothetical protein
MGYSRFHAKKMLLSQKGNYEHYKNTNFLFIWNFVNPTWMKSNGEFQYYCSILFKIDQYLNFK